MEPDRESASARSGVVDRPVAADWLQLRRAADHRARENTSGLIDRVDRWLGERLGPQDQVTVIDLGAGTGSNQEWLAPRLSVPQRWILLDHDAGLLDSGAATKTPQVVATSRVTGTVDTLPQLMPAETPALVTCAALLDLLSPQEAALIAETITRFQAAAVLSLTVTGEVSLSPQESADQTIAAAFDAHQRRDDLLGPDGVDVVAAALGDRGADVEIVQTDWALDTDSTHDTAQPQLVQRYLTDRADAAVEHDPSLRQTAEQWVTRRLAQLDSGSLSVRVGHQDLVALPPRWPATSA